MSTSGSGGMPNGMATSEPSGSRACIAAARASVDADIDVGDAWTDEAQGPVAEMQEAMTLVWRVLVVWGVVFAIFVLAGRIG